VNHAPVGPFYERVEPIQVVGRYRFVASRRRSALPCPSSGLNGSRSISQVAVTKILEQFPQDLILQCEDWGLSQDVFLITQTDEVSPDFGARS
jgi:hypothetical protein